jgi:hypothetical protein
VHAPVRFDGRWYVAYACSDLSFPAFGVVYAGDADGRKFEPIEATERKGAAFGDPVVDDDRLLVPEFDDDGLVAITSIG